MEYFTVRNWRKFQHYKDRNPPWVKLHFELLSSQDWVMLADASRCLLVACILIASRNDGKIPQNTEYLRRVAYLDNVDFKPLIDIGFLESASICVQMIPNARPETETYKEETPMSLTGVNGISGVRKRKTRNRISYTPEFESFWSEYPRGVGKGEAFIEWRKVLDDGYPAEKVIRSAKQFAEDMRREGRDESKIRHACRFLKKDFWKDFCFKEAE